MIFAFNLCFAEEINTIEEINSIVETDTLVKVDTVVIVDTVILKDTLIKSDTSKVDLSELDTVKVLNEQKLLSVGPMLMFVYYDEKFPPEDLIEMYGISKTVGEPKSTEYGSNLGVRVSYRRVFDNGLLIYPKIKLLLGPDTQYDGSTQGEPVVDPMSGDTVAYEFEPAEMKKDNLFVNGTVGLGYMFRPDNINIGLTVGVDARFWNRDLSGGIRELYYWINVPVSLIIENAPIKGWQFGSEITGLFMVAGAMDIRFPRIYNAFSDVTYPTLKLGNRAGLQAILYIRKFFNKDRFGVELSGIGEYYSFGKSPIEDVIDEYDGEVIGKVREPGSTTLWLGGNVRFLINFKKS